MTDNGMAMKGIGKKGEGRLTAWNAGMKRHQGHELGRWDPCALVWCWKGVLGQGVEVAPSRLILIYTGRFANSRVLKSRKAPLHSNGRSLVPLLENPKAKWKNCTIFPTAAGAAVVGKNVTRAEAKYYGASVRNQRWRLVFEMDSKTPWLSDISTDPGEART